MNMKQLRWMPLLLAAALTSSTCHAQNSGEIKGKVFNEAKKAVPFANVYVKYGDEIIGSTTDFDGRFTLKPLNPGTYNVEVSTVEYEKYIYTGVDVGPDKITFLNDIELAVKSLGVVVVKGWKEPLIDHEEPTKVSMVASQFKTDALRKDPVRLATTIAPGIFQDPISGDLHFKGSRSGSMAYYVDGVKMLSLDGTPPNSIGRITVYTGGIPARYGDITGGVIAIETKSYFDLYAQRQAERLAKE
jgi:hypothetical protein